MAVITLGVAAAGNHALAQHSPDPHELPVSQDADGDLLADAEETAINSDVSDPDQNGNLVPDGVELAKLCAADINDLPLENEADPNEICKGFAYTFGLEACDICGETVNMGGAWVKNPRRTLTVSFPILAIHYMEHGSFTYAGDVHGKGRIDLPLLVKILEMPRRCGDLGTIYLPGDLNKDCTENFKDIAEVADKWLESTDPRQYG